MVYREAQKSDLKAIAELMSESFSRYSYFDVYVADKDKRLKFMRAIQEMHTKLSFKNEKILVGVQNDKIVAVAILKAPNSPEGSILDYILAGGLNVIFTGGISSAFGLLGMTEEASVECHKQYPNAWYLTTLAVCSSCQGQGLGGKMINECIKPYILSQGGDMCTLITHSEENDRFYIKNGFVKFHSKLIRRNGKEITNWSYKAKINPSQL